MFQRDTIEKFVKLDELAFDSIDAGNLFELMKELEFNKKVKWLKIKKIQLGDQFKEENERLSKKIHGIWLIELKRLIEINTTLTQIDLNNIGIDLEGISNFNFLEALKKNINLRVLNMSLPQQTLVNKYLVRNKHLVQTAALLMKEFLKNALNEIPNAINEKLQLALQGDPTIGINNLRDIFQECCEQYGLTEKSEFTNFNNLLKKLITYCIEGEMSPLHAAAYYGFTQFIPQLIQFGIPVDAKSEFGLTPLDLAVRIGHLPTVKMLIDEYKANIPVVTMRYAQMGNHADVMSYLQTKVPKEIAQEEKQKAKNMAERRLNIVMGIKLSNMVGNLSPFISIQSLTELEGYETFHYYLKQFKENNKIPSR